MSEGSSKQASNMIFLTLKGYACLSLNVSRQVMLVCMAAWLISALPTSTSNDMPQIGTMLFFPSAAYVQFLARCWAHDRHSEMICYRRKKGRDRKFHVDTRAALSLPVFPLLYVRTGVDPMIPGCVYAWCSAYKTLSSKTTLTLRLASSWTSLRSDQSYADNNLTFSLLLQRKEATETKGFGGRGYSTVCHRGGDR